MEQVSPRYMENIKTVAKSIEGKSLTVREIKEKTDLPGGTVRSALTFLRRKDRIIKEGSENSPKKYRLKGEAVFSEAFFKL